MAIMFIICFLCPKGQGWQQGEPINYDDDDQIDNNDDNDDYNDNDNDDNNDGNDVFFFRNIFFIRIYYWKK